MGKSKPPVNVPATARGIAAYKKAMGGGIGKGEEPAAIPAAMPAVIPAVIPVAVDGLLKTGQLRPFPKTSKKADKAEPAQLSKYQQAARFMVLIGSDEASKILSRLEPEQVEAISKEIVSIKGINPGEAESVLEEFRSLLSPSFGYSGSSSGGVEEARRLLYAAFGPEKGEALLVKAVPGAARNPFDFLTDFSGEQLSLLFRDESPMASALVLSRLPSKLSAAVLANTSPERKLEIVRRIARQNEISPDVIERVAAALREKARHIGRSDAGAEVDGKSVLAAILKHSDQIFGDRLLEELEDEDPSLGREMKDRLYTLEDVAAAADRPIQDKLRTMDDRQIALLLRSRSESFTQKILRNLSSARAGRVREESEIMGPVPPMETEEAARDFLAWFRLSREEGRILMLSDEDVSV